MRADVVDIYHGDTVDSFHDMAASGVKAVIAKRSQGVSYLDPEFSDTERRIQSMEKPMLFGAYHFGTGDSGWEQATRFLNLIAPGTLMVLDIERNPTSQMSVLESSAFVDKCFQATGRFPVLYYGEWLLGQDWVGAIAHDSCLRKCPSWIARYGTPCPTPISGSDLVMWQFTGDGQGPEPHTVLGVSASCDISQWVGNVDDMPAFWEKHSR